MNDYELVGYVVLQVWVNYNSRGKKGILLKMEQGVHHAIYVVMYGKNGLFFSSKIISLGRPHVIIFNLLDAMQK